MRNKPNKKSLLQRQIPTILGLTVLAIAMVAGIFLLGQNTGAFSPRAAPETTPQKIKITNVTDNSFTVSFLTSDATVGFVRYGTEQNKLSSQVSDDRDQLSGSIGEYQTHHITIRGLQPKTPYYFVLGTGKSAQFDNGGNPYEITTAQRKGSPSAAQTVYGTITTAAGAPADGAIVYATIDGVGQMSSLVKSSGNWAIPLSNARTADGAGYADIAETDQVSLFVQGTPSQPTSNFATTVAEAQPVPSTVIGESPSGAVVATTTTPSSTASAAASQTSTETESEADPVTLDPSAYATPVATNVNQASGSATGGTTGQSALDIFNQAAAESSTASSSSVIDFSEPGLQTVQTGKPLIKGKALPNVTIAIEVNSETQIQQELVADENGDFQLDIAALSQELEPGEHTATYSYADPATGQQISRTVVFTVEGEPLGTGGTIAQAVPYSSSNPYTIGASSSATASESSTATTSTTVATGGATTTPSAIPIIDSPVPVSGTLETTIALIGGGLFFIAAGLWSFWLAKEWSTIVEE